MSFPKFWPLPPSGETAKFGYRLTSFQDPLGRTTQYEALQPGSHLVSRITDYRGRVTTQNWDFALGCLLSVTTPSASGGTATTTYTYESNTCQVTSVTDPLGRQTTTTVNATGDITSVTNPRGHTTTFSYSTINGDLLSVTNALNQTTTYTYDTLGNRLTTKDHLNHQTTNTFDVASRLTSVQDANGKTVQFAYDALDRVISRTQTLNGQPLTTSFQYDANSNRTALTDPKNQVWQWVFNSMDLVEQEKNPLNQVISTTFDLNNNVQTRTDRLGQRWEFSYGTGDRISSKTFRKTDGSVESTVTFSYDPTTHLLQSVTDSLFGTTSWTYDSLDRVVSEAGPNGTLTFTLHDKLNRRDGLQVSGQGAITYGFDNNDSLVSISQNGQTSSFTLDALNRTTLRSLPNGVTTEWAFDAAGFLTSLISKRSGTPFDSHSYVRDNIGNITQETVNGAVSTFGYDDLYRLVSATVGGVSHSWVYDNVGNRLSQTVGGVTTNYTYNSANRLLTVNGAAVSHDANGQLTAFGSDVYAWDVRGRLKSLTRPGFTYLFTYNQESQRVRKSVNGTVTDFLLDGASVVKETTGGVATHLLQGPGIDQVLQRGGKWFTPNIRGAPPIGVNFGVRGACSRFG